MVRRSRASRAARQEWLSEEYSTVEKPCATERSSVEVFCAMGTLDVLGKIPYGCLQRILCHVSLYDRYCFRAVCCQMQVAVVAVGINNPVTEIEANPDSLGTPTFCRFLSAMLQFYLPKACAHNIVLHRYEDGAHTFVCHACQGALRFDKKSSSHIFRIAFSI